MSCTNTKITTFLNHIIHLQSTSLAKLQTKANLFMGG